MCLTNTQILKMIDYVTTNCGCGDCGETTGSGGVIPNPNSSIMYYGRSASPTLTASEVQALTTKNVLNLSTTLGYSALASTYCYFAYKSSLGTPSTITDLSTGFDIALNTPFTVSILSVNYTVYRSFYQLGGAITFKLTQ